MDAAQLKDDMRVLGTQRDHFADEQNFPISRAQLTDEDLEYGKKRRDSLKLELENLRAQYQVDVTQLKDEVLTVGTKRNKFTHQQDILISISSSSRPSKSHL
jgi:hypothetical protein